MPPIHDHLADLSMTVESDDDPISSRPAPEDESGHAASGIHTS